MRNVILIYKIYSLSTGTKQPKRATIWRTRERMQLTSYNKGNYSTEIWGICSNIHYPGKYFPVRFASKSILGCMCYCCCSLVPGQLCRKILHPKLFGLIFGRSVYWSTLSNDSFCSFLRLLKTVSKVWCKWGLASSFSTMYRSGPQSLTTHEPLWFLFYCGAGFLIAIQCLKLFMSKCYYKLSTKMFKYFELIYNQLIAHTF